MGEITTLATRRLKLTHPRDRVHDIGRRSGRGREDRTKAPWWRAGRKRELGWSPARSGGAGDARHGMGAWGLAAWLPGCTPPRWHHPLSPWWMEGANDLKVMSLPSSGAERGRGQLERPSLPLAPL